MIRVSQKFGIAAAVPIIVCGLMTALYAGIDCSDSDRSLVHSAGQSDTAGTVACATGTLTFTIGGQAVSAGGTFNFPATTCPLSYKYWSGTEYKCGDDGSRAGTDCTTDTDAITVTEYNGGTCKVTSTVDFATQAELDAYKSNFAPCNYTKGQEFKEDSASTTPC
jgi:hypothetical protein